MIINVGNDQSLGDLQQKIGERSGTYYIIFSYVMAVIFGIYINKFSISFL